MADKNSFEFEDFEIEEQPGTSRGRGKNKTMAIISGVIGIILLISLVMLGLMMLSKKPAATTGDPVVTAVMTATLLNSEKSTTDPLSQHLGNASVTPFPQVPTALPTALPTQPAPVVLISSTPTTNTFVNVAYPTMTATVLVAVPAIQNITPTGVSSLSTLVPLNTPDAIVAFNASNPQPTIAANAINSIPSPVVTTPGSSFTGNPPAGNSLNIIQPPPPHPYPFPTPTGLPYTGFIEDAGLPSLFGLALIFLVLIVVARRLRLWNDA